VNATASAAAASTAASTRSESMVTSTKSRLCHRVHVL
jgi:hypothetical protein